MIANITTQVSAALTPITKQLIKDAHTVTKKSCIGDGAGLNHGNSSEKIMSCFISSIMPDTFEKFNSGESDFMICDTPLSYKHISGRSSIALVDIIIYVEKTSQWWKRGPKNTLNDIDYTQTIKAGLYLIDKKDCENIIFVTNNKSNTIISNVVLYNLLIISKQNFIDFPSEDAGFFKMEHPVKGLIPSDKLKENVEATRIFNQL